MRRAVGQLVPTGCLALGPTWAAQIEAAGTPLRGLCWCLGLHASTAWAWVQSLVGELRSCKPCSATKTEKKKKKTLRKHCLPQSLAPSTATHRRHLAHQDSWQGLRIPQLHVHKRAFQSHIPPGIKCLLPVSSASLYKGDLPCGSFSRMPTFSLAFSQRWSPKDMSLEPVTLSPS